MGGSGGSVAQTFPTYLQCVHSQALYGYDLTGNQGLYGKAPTASSFFGLLYHQLGAGTDSKGMYTDVNYKLNPYVTDAQFAQFTSAVSGSTFDGATLISEVEFAATGIDSALSEYEAYVDDVETGTWIDDNVTAYNTAMLPKFAQSVSRLANSFAGINALNSSAFYISMGLLEGARYQAAAAHRSELEARNSALVAELRGQLVDMHINVAKTKYVAAVDELEQKIDFRKGFLEWPIDLYRSAGNLISSVSGSSVPQTPVRNRAASALAGALGGASVGASLVGKSIAGATITGPIGIGVGALLGLGAGLLS